MTKLTMKRSLVVVVAIGCLAIARPAWAVSGRALAIGRAFNYNNNNPQQQVGSGPLGSSVYSGRSQYNVPSGGVAPTPSYRTQPGPLAAASRAATPYAPMAPAMIGASGSPVAMASGAYSNPVRDAATVLADANKEAVSITAKWLTSLAPDDPGTVRHPMLEGEAAMRAGDYKQAARKFEAARVASGGSAETQLALAHAYLMLGGQYGDMAGESLAKALAAFPDLPLVRVRPQEFLSGEQAYTDALAKLATYVKHNPNAAEPLFLLGYMQWRDGNTKDARASLEAARQLATDRGMGAGIDVLLAGMNEAREDVLADAPPMGQPQDFAWAGIGLALPSGVKFSPLASPNQVISGILPGAEGKSSRLVTLYAYPLAEGVTLNTAMDSVANTMGRFSFVTDMRVEAEADVPFQTGQALVRVFTYSTASSDARIAAGWVGFIRPGQPRIGYLLGVATAENQADDILPTLAAMAKTVTLGEFKVPSLAAFDGSGDKYEDRQMGFSIVQPGGWAGRQSDKGFQMGQTILANGTAVSPEVEILVETIPGTYTAKSFGEEAVKLRTPKGMVRKILSEGPAELGGIEGCQFVGTQSPEGGDGSGSMILAGRLILLDRPDGRKQLYALVIRATSASAQDVESLMDKIASGFALLKKE
jgi:tetratricopeptide (TPR) repeat protein